MTPANFDALCAEHAASTTLVQAITTALAEARSAAPHLELGIIEDALSDFRGAVMAGIAAEIDAYDAQEEPTAYRQRATFHMGVL